MNSMSLPDMRFASTIRNSFQTRYNVLMKDKLKKEGKLGTQEIKPFSAEKDNYLKMRVVSFVILKQVIIMPLLQSALYAQVFIVCKPWIHIVVRNGVSVGMNMKNWIDKFVLFRSPKTA